MDDQFEETDVDYDYEDIDFVRVSKSTRLNLPKVHVMLCK